MGRSLSRNAQVFLYFLRHSSGLGHTRLLKLAYLADLEARRLLGSPISTLRYIFHRHGPFDPALYESVAELERAGLARVQEVRYPSGQHEKQVVATTQAPDVSGFTPAETQVLAYVARQYGGMDLGTLLQQVVYQTRPMRRAERGASVPVEMENNVDRQEIGFDLNEIIAAEQEAERGNYVTADAFFDALRAEIAADGPA